MDNMTCLCDIISSTGWMNGDFIDAVGTVWGAWYANVTEGLFTAAVPLRLRFINACLRPMMSYKWSKGPWTDNMAKRSDQLHRHLIATALWIPALPGETAAAYYLRRHCATRLLTDKKRGWSNEWAISLRRWHDHFVRRSDSKTGAATFIRSMGLNG